MGQKLGFKHTEESKRKIGIKNSGSNNLTWKGNKAGYIAIHTWIRTKLGRAQEKECVDCGVTGMVKRLEWSNINHLYRRIIGDYQVRCISCHRKHDKENQLPRFDAIKIS